eukprot:scaffold9156_cov120-Isochrysis_galbana.AAC.7
MGCLPAYQLRLAALMALQRRRDPSSAAAAAAGTAAAAIAIGTGQAAAPAKATVSRHHSSLLRPGGAGCGGGARRLTPPFCSKSGMPSENQKTPEPHYFNFPQQINSQRVQLLRRLGQQERSLHLWRRRAHLREERRRRRNSGGAGPYALAVCAAEARGTREGFAGRSSRVGVDSAAHSHSRTVRDLTFWTNGAASGARAYRMHPLLCGR